MLCYLRRKLIGNTLPFKELLDRLHLRVHAADFLPLGNATTPPFLPIRFDTDFFLAQTPPMQEPEVWPGELESGEWATPGAMLERWRSGKSPVSPPTVTLERL